MPARWCQDCNALFDAALTGTWRFPACQREARRAADRRRDRPSATARGYGTAHRATREAMLRALKPGSPCVRCGHPMHDLARVQLDHNADRTGYLGFSHGSPCQDCGKVCNPAAGGAANRRAGPL